MLSPILASSAALPLLPHDEQGELALQAQAGDRGAREKLIRHQIRSVLATIRKMRLLRHREIEDLLQVGLGGLNEAIDRWRPDGGANLNTFASFMVRQRVAEYMTRSPMIRGPINHIPSAERRPFTPPAIASLETTLGGADGATLGDTLAAEVTEADRPDVDLALRRVIEAIPAGILGVVVRRLYLGPTQPTLEQVGSIAGVSRERIRQIAERALDEMAGRLRISRESLALALALEALHEGGIVLCPDPHAPFEAPHCDACGVEMVLTTTAVRCGLCRKRNRQPSRFPMQPTLVSPSAPASAFERAKSLQAEIADLQEQLDGKRNQLRAIAELAKRELADLQRAVKGKPPKPLPPRPSGARLDPGSRGDRIVAHLRKQGRPATVGEIAAALKDDNTNVNACLISLTGRGFVRRSGRGVYEAT